jgi:hypothetical protein
MYDKIFYCKFTALYGLNSPAYIFFFINFITFDKILGPYRDVS